MMNTLKVHIILATILGMTLFVMYGIFLENPPSQVIKADLHGGGVKNGKILVHYNRTVRVYRPNAATIGWTVLCDGLPNVEVGARPLNWVAGDYELESVLALPLNSANKPCRLQAVLAWNTEFSIIQHLTHRAALPFVVNEKGEIVK